MSFSTRSPVVSLVRSRFISSSSSSSSSSLAAAADRTSPDRPDDDPRSRPLRSVLYVPASNARALEKLDALAGRARPDAVMFDLEDGVYPNMKDEARGALASYLRERRTGRTSSSSSSSLSSATSVVGQLGLLRINRTDTSWFEDDAIAAYKLATDGSIDGIVLPKVEGGEDVDVVVRRFLDLSSSTSSKSSAAKCPVPLWAMVETPRAVLAASEIAGKDDVVGLILGTNDLGRDLGLRRRRRRGEDATDPTVACDDREDRRHSQCRMRLAASLQWTVLAARAHGKVVIDGVYNDLRDEVGFRAECDEGYEWGMDGKTLIHPMQVPWTNDIYEPDEDEIDHARRVVRCWEDAIAATATANADATTIASGARSIEGSRPFTGVAVLDGAMIEQLHVDVARRLLRRADIIKSMY
jgi:(3S)-malyl-CoA thioesterase